MAIKLSRYKTLKTFNGQSSNRIQIVRDEKLNKKFVLKRMKIEKMDQQMKEIKIQKQLIHKNIIRIFNYEITDKEIVILMEYAENGDLYMNLDKFRNLSIKQILKFFRQILDAVNYIHKKGFIHRDIKPENILIDSKFKPLIADFGTAIKRNSKSKVFTGTIGYMAPEVLMRKSFNEKCDVWGLGILLYELLHDQVLFLDNSLEQIQMMISCDLIQFRQKLPSSIKKFIKKMLIWNPKKRPTCEQLLRDEVFSMKIKQSRKTTLPQKRLAVNQKIQDNTLLDIARKNLKSQNKRLKNQKVSKISTPHLLNSNNKLTKKKQNCGSMNLSLVHNKRLQKQSKQSLISIQRGQRESRNSLAPNKSQQQKFLQYLKTDFIQQKNEFSKQKRHKKIDSTHVDKFNRSISKPKAQQSQNLLKFSQQKSLQSVVGKQNQSSIYPIIYEQRNTLGSNSKVNMKKKSNLNLAIKSKANQGFRSRAILGIKSRANLGMKSRAQLGLKNIQTQKNLKLKRKRYIA